MKTNDIKSGTSVRLKNGWLATIIDNRRGNIRTATVQGIYEETGSIYASDIVQALVDDAWVKVEHNAAQNKGAALRAAMGL